jgi:threonine synthase
MKVLGQLASMWRYADALPLAGAEHRVSLGEGWTPLIDAPRSAEALGCARLLIKDEGQNPTGTFKDRSASYSVSRLRERGARGIVLHSTGNAGAAFATYAARAGIKCVAVVPKDVLDANLLQLRLAGAEILPLDDWSRAGFIAAEYAQRLGYTDMSANRTPDRRQGKKTLGYEIAEQLDWQLPDVVVCPTGGGTAALALHGAFDDLLALGLAHGPRPQLIISQYAGCAPLAEAHAHGRATMMPWARIETPRGGMRTPSPALGAELLAAVAGAYAIDPEVALTAADAIARADGILIGLEAGTALAAAARALDRGDISRRSNIVVINTATALKSEAFTVERTSAPKMQPAET